MTDTGTDAAVSEMTGGPAAIASPGAVADTPGGADMDDPTNITSLVPESVFARMRAIPALADVLDPDHGPHGLLDALEALGDGTLLRCAAEAVDEALACVPAEYRRPL